MANNGKGVSDYRPWSLATGALAAAAAALVWGAGPGGVAAVLLLAGGVAGCHAALVRRPRGWRGHVALAALLLALGAGTFFVPFLVPQRPERPSGFLLLGLTLLAQALVFALFLPWKDLGFAIFLPWKDFRRLNWSLLVVCGYALGNLVVGRFVLGRPGEAFNHAGLIVFPVLLVSCFALAFWGLLVLAPPRQRGPNEEFARIARLFKRCCRSLTKADVQHPQAGDVIDAALCNFQSLWERAKKTLARRPLRYGRLRATYDRLVARCEQLGRDRDQLRVELRQAFQGLIFFEAFRSRRARASGRRHDAEEARWAGLGDAWELQLGRLHEIGKAFPGAGRRLARSGRGLREVWDRLDVLFRQLPGNPNFMQAQIDHLARRCRERKEKCDALQDRLALLNGSPAAEGPRPRPLRGPGVPDEQALVRTLRQLKSHDLRTLAWAVHDRWEVLKARRGLAPKYDVVSFQRFLAREILMEGGLVLAERLLGQGASQEFDETVVQEAKPEVIGAVLRHLRKREATLLTDELAGKLDELVAKSLFFLKDLLYATPPCRLLFAGKETAFDPDRHEPILGSPPDGVVRIVHTVFPGLVLLLPDRPVVLEKARVRTAAAPAGPGPAPAPYSPSG
jgi:hypothetical protein